MYTSPHVKCGLHNNLWYAINNMKEVPAILIAFPCVTASVAAAIADVFRGKNRINVGNKLVGISKIFTKINEVKTRGVI